MLLAELYVPADRRFGDRRDVRAGGTIRIGRQPREIVVLDLSQGGFRMTADAALADGTEVRLGLPGVGAFDARVTWSDGSEYGCAFTTPLTPDQFANAYQGDNVFRGPFEQAPRVQPTDHPLPRLRLRTRIYVIVALCALLWAIIWAAI